MFVIGIRSSRCQVRCALSRLGLLFVNICLWLVRAGVSLDTSFQGKKFNEQANASNLQYYVTCKLKAKWRNFIYPDSCALNLLYVNTKRVLINQSKHIDAQLFFFLEVPYVRKWLVEIYKFSRSPFCALLC